LQASSPPDREALVGFQTSDRLFAVTRAASASVIRMKRGAGRPPIGLTTASERKHRSIRGSNARD
jgi:hypothetical protein